MIPKRKLARMFKGATKARMTIGDGLTSHITIQKILEKKPEEPKREPVAKCITELKQFEPKVCHLCGIKI